MHAKDSGLGWGDADDVQPCYRNLLIAVEYHHGRWSDTTVAAASAMKHCESLSPREWAETLDRIERALRGVLPELPTSGIIRSAKYLGN